MGGQSGLAKVTLDALGLGLRQEAEPGREIEGERHAERHRLAMQQAAGEVRRRLEGMAEGVAEIEQRAIAGLALVARDDLGLHAAAGGDRMLARRAGAGEDVVGIGLEPGEEAGIAEQAVFGDLRIAGAELARRKGIEQRRVGDHQDRLVEGADQIFAVARIDRGLAADRGIDLGQQGGRHLDVIEAAPHRGGAKAREVAHHPAAESNDDVAALELRGDQRLAHALEHGEALGALARRHADVGRRHIGGGEPRLRGRQQQLLDIGVGDDRGLGAGLERLQATPERAEQPAPDHDVIRARAERDRHGDWIAAAQRRRHDAPSRGATRERSAATISSTMLSCGTSRDATVRSASA